MGCTSECCNRLTTFQTNWPTSSALALGRSMAEAPRPPSAGWCDSGGLALEKPVHSLRMTLKCRAIVVGEAMGLQICTAGSPARSPQSSEQPTKAPQYLACGPLTLPDLCGKVNGCVPIAPLFGVGQQPIHPASLNPIMGSAGQLPVPYRGPQGDGLSVEC